HAAEIRRIAWPRRRGGNAKGKAGSVLHIKGLRKRNAWTPARGATLTCPTHFCCAGCDVLSPPQKPVNNRAEGRFPRNKAGGRQGRCDTEHPSAEAGWEE